jgi:hypothetical protein
MSSRYISPERSLGKVGRYRPDKVLILFDSRLLSIVKRDISEYT